jgi:hypothetical protein
MTRYLEAPFCGFGKSAGSLGLWLFAFEVFGEQFRPTYWNETSKISAWRMGNSNSIYVAMGLPPYGCWIDSRGPARVDLEWMRIRYERDLDIR